MRRSILMGLLLVGTLVGVGVAQSSTGPFGSLRGSSFTVNGVTSPGVFLLDTNGAPTTAGGGTQYTEGDTDASISGTAVMWEDAADTLATVKAAKPLPVAFYSGGVAITPATDATHDSAASTTGPNVLGECDDTATDAVDEGDAGKMRVNCTNRALLTSPTGVKLGGGTPVTMKSDNTNNDDETAICTGACTIYTIVAFNHAAASAFLRCENDTAGNTTPGSEANADGEPEIEIPGNTAGAGLVITYPVGMSFATALTCWIATGEAATDATDAATDDVAVHFTRVQ